MIQTNSQVVTARARYSASAEEREVVVCFLDLQDTRESPRKMHKPVTYRQVFGQDAQSASEKALIWSKELAEK